MGGAEGAGEQKNSRQNKSSSHVFLLLASVPLVDQVGNQCGPPGLVARANAGAVVAVVVLVKEQVIAPVGIVGKLRRAAMHRPPLVFVEQEDIDHPAGDVARDRLERDRLTARARRGTPEL